MWTYSQSTGALKDPAGKLLGHGYAGAGEGKNNPAMQTVHNVGPLPVGLYTIGRAYKDPHLGPLAMWLIPDKANQMYGRSGFLIHADATTHPGTASRGCIVLPPAIRQVIAKSKDRLLAVVQKSE